MNKDSKKQIKMIPTLTDDVLYVDDNENIDLTLSTTSWASQIESELGNSINDEKLTGSNVASTWNVKSDVVKCKGKDIEVDELIKLNMDDFNDLELLEYQTLIVNHLRKVVKHYTDKYLQNKDKIFDTNDFIKKLEWMLGASKKLSDKLGLQITLHSYKSKSIPRSSYKFCDYGYECEYNYDKKHDGCFAQHYVHNFIYSDIKALLEYMINSNTEDDSIKFFEIIKCMNTISYVIGHMRDELKDLSFYNSDNYLDLHKERIPDGKNKKQFIPKKKNKKKKIITVK